MSGIKKIIFRYVLAMLIFSVISAVFWVTRVNSDSEYYRLTILPIVIAIPMVWLLTSIGSLTRHILWRVKGHNNIPIFIYPLVLTKMKSWKCTLVFDPVGLWSVVSPSKYLENIHKNSVEKNLPYTIEKAVIISEGLVMLIAICITILSRDWFLFNAEVICSLFFLVTAFINEDFLHGQIVRMRAIKHGSILRYAMNCAIIYGLEVDSLVVHWLWLTPDNLEKEKFDLLNLTSWKYLILLACSQRYIFDADLSNYIEKEIINGADLFGKLFYSAELVEIVKLYMYYGIILDDNDKVNLATRRLSELRESETYPMGDGMKSVFDWYLDIGKYRRIYDFAMNGREVPILKKDYPYCKFENYKLSAQTLEKMLQSMCTVKSRNV